MGGVLRERVDAQVVRQFRLCCKGGEDAPPRPLWLGRLNRLQSVVVFNRNGLWWRDASREYGPPVERPRGRLIGRIKRGMNTRLHTVADADGRPIHFSMTAGQSATILARRLCPAACRGQSGCWPTVAMTPTGSGKH